VDFSAIRPGDRLELFREYDNPYDPNAVRVVHEGCFIGYVGRDLAARLAVAMDAGQEAHGLVLEITGGTVDSPNRGINMTVVVSQEVSDLAFVGTPGR
jgi:hypothetical protein